MIEPDEAAVALVRIECARDRGNDAGRCPHCRDGACQSASAWGAAAWIETAATLGVAAADLLALARKEAVITRVARHAPPPAVQADLDGEQRTDGGAHD